MKTYLLLASVLLFGVMPMKAEIEDDIYYNPKKAAHQSNQSDSNKKKSQNNYIANYQDIDVDYYNSRGQYYTSPVDTIGEAAEMAPDFVYTTQIQKYYNPTIVVDNENVLGDVLNNSYGNVTIEYNVSGVPYFAGIVDPYYPYYWNTRWAAPYYGYAGIWGNPWFYGPSISWSFSPYWSVGWSWGWNWGWGPGYWGPGYWGPNYYPGRPYYASYRPGGMRPAGAQPGWSNSTRPGYNYAGNTHRPSGTARPGMASPSGNHHATSGNYGRQPGQGAYQSTRPGSASNATGNRYGTSSGNSTRPGYTIGKDGHRYTNNSGSSTTAPGRNNGNGSTSNGSIFTYGMDASTAPKGNGNRNSGSTTHRSTTSSGYNSGSKSNSSSSSSSGYRSSGSSNSGSSTGRSYGGSSSGRSYGGGSTSGRSYGGGGGGRGGRR